MKNIFNVNDQDKISKIETEYGFKSGFLVEKLSGLPTNVAMHKQKLKDYPRLSKIKKSIDNLLKISNKLNEELSKTSTQTILFLQDTPHIVASKTDYTKLQKETQNWDIQQFRTDVDLFHQVAHFASDTLEKDTGGQIPNSIPKYITFVLASIYEKGTGVEPTCGWDEIDECYVGKFFEFLISLAPILKVLGFKLGTYKSTGRNAIECIASYRKALAKLKADEAFLEQLKNTEYSI